MRKFLAFPSKSESLFLISLYRYISNARERPMRVALSIVQCISLISFISHIFGHMLINFHIYICIIQKKAVILRSIRKNNALINDYYIFHAHGLYYRAY